ncbi:hypothetical protein [Streptomyces sp. NPDC001893]|uniref:hypothetical protein n=1 Tax=Streptomyces sp. NPDC001893 TaxID=3154530 RepID=UPI0033258D35
MDGAPEGRARDVLLTPRGGNARKRLARKDPPNTDAFRHSKTRAVLHRARCGTTATGQSA